MASRGQHGGKDVPPSPPTRREVAMYSRDLLLSMKRLVLEHDLSLLGHLLEIAALEARRIAEARDVER